MNNVNEGHGCYHALYRNSQHYWNRLYNRASEQVGAPVVVDLFESIPSAVLSLKWLQLVELFELIGLLL